MVYLWLSGVLVVAGVVVDCAKMAAGASVSEAMRASLVKCMVKLLSFLAAACLMPAAAYVSDRPGHILSVAVSEVFKFLQNTATFDDFKVIRHLAAHGYYGSCTGVATGSRFRPGCRSHL